MGTHPIFEADFDCLTELFVRNGLKIGELIWRNPLQLR